LLLKAVEKELIKVGGHGRKIKQTGNNVESDQLARLLYPLKSFLR